MIRRERTLGSRLIFAVWREQDSSFDIRILNCVDIYGPAGRMVRERCTAGFQSVIEGRSVVGDHRKVVIPASVLSKTLVGYRNHRINREPHFERRFENNFDVSDQIFIDYELTLMDHTVKRIIL